MQKNFYYSEIEMETTTINAFEQIIKEEFEASHNPGIAGALLSNNEVVWKGYFGLADIQQQKKLDHSTVFKFASISKLFTIIAIMQFYEQGKFKLDDPVNNYLPKKNIIVRKGDPEVTFRHIMTHTSGIGELRKARDIFKHGFGLLVYDNEPIPPLRTLHDLPLTVPSTPGSKFHYSNIAVSLLGYLVEVFSGMPFHEYIKTYIFKPLGMHNSSFIPEEKVRKAEAVGYKYIKKKNNWKPAKYWINVISPSGGLYSTIPDMCSFLKCLGRFGEYESGRLLKKETFEIMWTTHYSPHPAIQERVALGLVFWLYFVNGKRYIAHTGGTSGFTSALFFCPEDGTGMIVVSNLSEGLHNRVTHRIRNRAFKLLNNLQDPKNEMESRDADRFFWKKMAGTYGCYPGWLSNTRIITDGIEYTIFEKNDSLWMKTLVGKGKIPKKLYPTADPLVYEYYGGEAGTLFYTERIGFHKNRHVKITDMAIEYDKLRKVPFTKTQKFRIYKDLSILFLLILFITSILLI
jgi:CubicO group peptidase (beta-lactamase class C family)